MSAFVFLTRWVLRSGCLLAPLQATWGQAPVVTAVSPLANERAAPASGAVTVRVSQALTPGSASALQVFSSQRGGRRTQAASPPVVSGNALLFTPPYPFQPGEQVHYTVSRQATSSSGALAQPWVGQFTVATGASTGLFEPGSEPGVGQSPITVVTGDVDGDGDLDLLTANFAGSAVSVRLNNGHGVFGNGSTVGLSGNVRSLALGDIDGDGDLDLLAPDYSNGSGALVNIRVNNGQGTFSGTQFVVVGPGAYGVALGDVDGDGDLDLLTAASSAGSVNVHFNNGQGAFSSHQTVPVGRNDLNLAVGDVDNDGDLDLLTGNSNENTVSIRLNDGQGTFSGNQTVAVAGAPFSIALGDVDGDHDLDVLTAGPNANSTVSVRLNNGRGLFGGGSEVPIGNGVANGCFSVVVADVEGDGDLDLLAANANGGGPGMVIVRLNDGRGGFSGSQNVAVGRSAQSVAVGDVDSDGDLDLLCANGNENTVSVRLNGGTASPTVRLSGPAVLCAGQMQTLTAVGTPMPVAYQWNTGATTASIVLTQPGLYTVTATFAGGQTAQAQQVVTVAGPLAAFGGDTTLCVGEEVILQGPVGVGYTYQWSDGTTDAFLRVHTPGTYGLQVRTTCGQQQGNWQVLPGPCPPIPNIITPNGDGLNDRLVLPYPGPGPWTLEVYSRWGHCLYRRADYHNEWGSEAVAELYYYVLRSATTAHKGWVEVVR